MQAHSVCLHFRSATSEHSEGAPKKLGSMKEENNNTKHTVSVLDFRGTTDSEELPKHVSERT